MNEIYQGVTGKTYHVSEKRIAGGGEGSIHEIEGENNLVAKVFKENRRTPDREKKLSLMVKTKLNKQQLEQITWPQDVLYDKSGFAGYIMPRLKKVTPLNEIYSNGNCSYDLRFRLLAAVNLCAAVQTVHETGQVCGDLNPQNICINLDKNDPRVCRVTLVDTDSYHFSAEGNTYRCEVGLADYIAPEVQKKMTGGTNLRNANLPTYTKETDLFAVAVHVFTLLMNGCHPFACAKDVNGRFENTMEQTTGNTRDSVVAPQPIENIKDGFFPFAKHKVGIRTPIYAPEFSSLPESLRALFIRTFLDGYRDPSKRVGTEEWIQELDRVKNDIVPCSDNSKHYYFKHNVKCSLCAVEEAFMSYMSDENKHSRANDSENKESVNNVTYINNSSGGSGNVNARGNTKSTALKKRKSNELLLAGILLIISGMWMFFEEAMNLDDFGFSSNVDDLIGLWCLTGWCLLFGSGIIMLTTYLTVKSSSMTANDFNMSETNRIYGVLFIVFGLGEAYNIYYLYNAGYGVFTFENSVILSSILIGWMILGGFESSAKKIWLLPGVLSCGLVIANPITAGFVYDTYYPLSMDQISEYIITSVIQQFIHYTTPIIMCYFLLGYWVSHRNSP